MKNNYILDLETSDPDDIFTLAFLATHPKSNLVGVTIHPGGKDQVGLVKHVLNLLDKKDIPVGAGNPKSDKPRVSGFHYKYLGKIEDKEADAEAVTIIDYCAKNHSPLHLVTGAALTNIAAFVKGCDPFVFESWTCQGGFAGDNVVPKEYRLEKFDGMVTCPTFNLNGDPKAALYLLNDSNQAFKQINMVSKNVCHGIFWTPEFDDSISYGKHAGLDFVKKGMKKYFEQKHDGKALHDIVAAACAINPEIATWIKAAPYRENGKWGCNIKEDSNIQTIIKLDVDGFKKVLEG